MENPYPRKPIQTELTITAAASPATGQTRPKSGIDCVMNGGSDVKSGIDVTTTWAFAVTSGPFLLLFATQVVPLCYHLKIPAVATGWDLVRATQHYTRRRFGAGGRGEKKRPAFATLSRVPSLNLYRTAHSESTVDKRDNSTGPRSDRQGKFIDAEIYGGAQIARRP